MNIYFDTEFTGLVPDTTLISIGMVADNGQQFYGEFTDYNEDLCDDWIKQNVLENLTLKDEKKGYKNQTYDCLYVKGSEDYICSELDKWLKTFNEETDGRIQLVSDVCHYDMVLFCNLFGGAFKIPDNVNPACYDINQDLMNYYSKNSDSRYYICDDKTGDKAFDSSRERFLKNVLNVQMLTAGNKHNSLYDAHVIKSIYEGLRKKHKDS